MIEVTATREEWAENAKVLFDVGCVSKNEADTADNLFKWKYCAARNRKKIIAALDKIQETLVLFAEEARKDIDQEQLDTLAVREREIVNELCDKNPETGKPILNEAGSPTFATVGQKETQLAFDKLHKEMWPIVAAEKKVQSEIDEHAKRIMAEPLTISILRRPLATVPTNLDAEYLQAAGFMIDGVPSDSDVEE